MNALDRMKRLVGLEGGSSRQQTPVALGTSSENGPLVKMTNPVGIAANSLEQRQLVEETPLALDLALTTFNSDFNPSEYREHCDRPLHSSAQSNQPLCQPLRDDPPAIGHDADPPSLFDSCAAIIEGTDSSSSSKAPYTRGHRRRSTHVTRRDLEKFQKEVLGVDNRPAWYDEENGSSLSINPYDPQLAELNLAFERADMSMTSGAGGMAGGNNPGPNMYNYTENSPTPNMGSMQRQSPNPAYPHPAPQVNGAGAGVGGMGAAMNASMSMNAGHQMDLHHLYEMVMELSEVLKNNREVTKNIVTSAEEIMKHGNSEDASAVIRQVNGEISAARISELERALAKEKRLVEDLRREQVENTKLISDYEASVGTMVEQIRNYCQNNNMHFLYQKSHYNNLLQAERDAHLESRLDRDYWHTQTMKCAQMIRNAHQIRSTEEDLPVRIISGLQNEVRAYRNALGMEPEKPEEEYGWEILKDVSSPE